MLPCAVQVRQYGRNGIQARVLRLNIYQAQPATAAAAAAEEPASSSSSSSSAGLLTSVRVLPKLVHVHSVTQQVENFNFMFCPQDRLVRVNIPVKLWNNDVSPGVKGGGWLHVVNRTIPVLAKGWAVKPYFELDMKHMKAKDVLRFRDVEMPEGCQLHASDPMQPVVRCAVRVGGE
jgi:large subunit ribosomal protein L25